MRTRVAVVIAVILLPLWIRAAAADGSCGDDVDCQSAPTVGVSGGTGGFTTSIVYRSDGTSVDIRPPAGAGIQYEYQLAPACSTNTGSDPDTACRGAFSCPDPSDYEYSVFYREIAPDQGDWQRGEEVCLSPTPLQPPHPDVTPVVDSFVNTMPIDPSPILYAPPTGGVVNVPVIFHTTGAPVVGSTSAYGVTVTVTATPHWHWDFGDQGATQDTDSPGLSYDGTDPRKTEGYYIDHTYEEASNPTITLTATWTATFTRSDESGVFMASGSTTRTTTKQIPVHEYEARLTGAG